MKIVAGDGKKSEILGGPAEGCPGRCPVEGRCSGAEGCPGGDVLGRGCPGFWRRRGPGDPKRWPYMETVSKHSNTNFGHFGQK